MTQKVSQKKVSKISNVSGGSGQQLQVVFTRLYNLYDTNKKLWAALQQAQDDINDLRSQIKKVA